MSVRISGITYASRKTNRLRNSVVFIIILLLIASISLCAVSLYKGWKLTHPSRVPIPPVSSISIPECKDISFSSLDQSLTLKGWYFQSKNSDKTVILVHDYGKSRLQFGDRTFDMIKSFLGQGFNVLTFDLRASGISDGKTSSFGVYEKDDLIGAVNYAKSKGSRHIILMGFATGASACVMAAEDSKYNNVIDAIIADDAYSLFDHYFDETLCQRTGLPRVLFNNTIQFSINLIAGFDSNKSNPISAVIKINPRPILFIGNRNKTSGSRDLYNTYYGTAGEKSVYWESEGFGSAEGYTTDPKGYMERVSSFLDTVYPKSK